MKLDVRIPEPELMEDRDQVKAYAAADFEAAHSHLLEQFRQLFPGDLKGTALDLGCGPGDISLRLARLYPELRVVGVDGSAEMLAEARRLCPPEVASRVEFVHGFLPGAPIAPGPYSAVISNSLLHHLHEPAGLWQVVREFATPGTRVFIGDLMRPDTSQEAQEITERYAGDEPEVLKRDFYNSLLAAFRPAEIEQQLQAAGLNYLKVRAVSDRHLIVSGTA